MSQTRQIIWGKNLFKVIKYFNDTGYYIIILTNQSGVGRGIILSRC